MASGLRSGRLSDGAVPVEIAVQRTDNARARQSNSGFTPRSYRDAVLQDQANRQRGGASVAGIVPVNQASASSASGQLAAGGLLAPAIPAGAQDGAPPAPLPAPGQLAAGGPTPPGTQGDAPPAPLPAPGQLAAGGLPPPGAPGDVSPLPAPGQVAAGGLPAPGAQGGAPPAPLPAPGQLAAGGLPPSGTQGGAPPAPLPAPGQLAAGGLPPPGAPGDVPPLPAPEQVAAGGLPAPGAQGGAPPAPLPAPGQLTAGGLPPPGAPGDVPQVPLPASGQVAVGGLPPPAVQADAPPAPLAAPAASGQLAAGGLLPAAAPVGAGAVVASTQCIFPPPAQQAYGTRESLSHPNIYAPPPAASAQRNVPLAFEPSLDACGQVPSSTPLASTQRSALPTAQTYSQPQLWTGHRMPPTSATQPLVYAPPPDMWTQNSPQPPAQCQIYGSLSSLATQTHVPAPSSSVASAFGIATQPTLAIAYRPPCPSSVPAIAQSTALSRAQQMSLPPAMQSPIYAPPPAVSMQSSTLAPAYQVGGPRILSETQSFFCASTPASAASATNAFGIVNPSMLPQTYGPPAPSTVPASAQSVVLSHLLHQAAAAGQNNAGMVPALCAALASQQSNTPAEILQQIGSAYLNATTGYQSGYRGRGGRSRRGWRGRGSGYQGRYGRNNRRGISYTNYSLPMPHGYPAAMPNNTFPQLAAQPQPWNHAYQHGLPYNWNGYSCNALCQHRN